MNEQYQKSLTKLELDKVLALLADHASSPAAKERCLAVRPLDDAEDIRLLQAQTSAACKLITLKGSPSFGGIVDVGASLSRADRGGCLSPEELLRVATVLKAARTAKEYAEGDAVESGLDIFFRQLTPNKFFDFYVHPLEGRDRGRGEQRAGLDPPEDSAAEQQDPRIAAEDHHVADIRKNFAGADRDDSLRPVCRACKGRVQGLDSGLGSRRVVFRQHIFH